MSPRIVAPALFLVAALVHVGITLPSREQAAQARSEERRLRAATREARQRVAALERREGLLRRAAGALSTPDGVGDPVALRQALLASLEGARVSGVRLDVRPGRAPVGASAHVTAEGRSAEVLRLSGYLVRQGTGVVLERVHFTPHGADLVLELDALSLGGRL